MKNNYRIIDGVVYIEINHHGRTVYALVDEDDLDLVNSVPNRWSAYESVTKASELPYVLTRRTLSLNNREYIHLHRFLCGNPERMVVDHINGNSMDNRRSNLRVCTKQHNNQNLKGPNRQTTSGIRNVHWIEKTRKWSVNLKFHGKTKCFGTFSDIEEAARVASEARAKYYPYSDDALVRRNRNETD